MRNQYLLTIIFSFLAAVITNAYCAPDESVVLDPNTGDYLITYYGAGAPGDKKHRILRQTIFVPATKIDPTVNSVFKLGEESKIAYAYSVTNGIKSRQPLISMLFDPVTDIVSALPLPKRYRDIDLNTIAQIDAAGVSALTTPSEWVGRTTTSHMGGLRIGWSYIGNADGLALGKAQEGFGFSSKDIPGIGMAQMQGDAPVPSYPDDGPSLNSEVSKQLEPIEQNNFVPRPAAVPTIAVPVPFDAATLLDRIQTQMHTWIGMSLLDATFSSQLDRTFQSAISAFRLNQPKVGNQQIQAMLVLIRKEQPNAGNNEGDSGGSNHGNNHQNSGAPVLIDPLAARVLDFDLNYVMKRMNVVDQSHESPGATSPTLSVALNPATLWPPNGKLVPITAVVTVKNNNGSAQKIRLESITANETLAAGDIQNAQLGTDDRSFFLAAKRTGNNQAGRIYTVTYSATDASGNKATASATVTVPHDQGR